MTNADKFKHLFGIYATELWAMPENNFLEWLNADAQDMPTAERKTGKWIIHETETDRYDDMKCPFCKKSYTVDAYRIDDIGFTAADFNFCPSCGADMRGEQNGE